MAAGVRALARWNRTWDGRLRRSCRGLIRRGRGRRRIRCGGRRRRRGCRGGRCRAGGWDHRHANAQAEECRDGESAGHHSGPARGVAPSRRSAYRGL